MSTHKIILRGDVQRQLAKRYIDQAPIGYVVTLKEQTRTTEQNSRFWAMLGDVSRSKPEGRQATPDVWKELFMNALGHESRFEMGLDGKPFPAGFRSSKLTVSEMSELMEFISAWGSERGVEWTEPEYRDEPRNRKAS